jgi:hypothetical protein
MKYIKTYENLDEINKYQGIFYFIPYNDKVLVPLAIDKINTSNELKEKIMDDTDFFYKLYNRTNIGFIMGIRPDCKKYPYQYYICNNEVHKKNGITFYLEDNSDTIYTYGGIIELEDWQITSYKYNI